MVVRYLLLENDIYAGTAGHRSGTGEASRGGLRER